MENFGWLVQFVLLAEEAIKVFCQCFGCMQGRLEGGGGFWKEISSVFLKGVRGLGLDNLVASSAGLACLGEVSYEQVRYG